MNGEAGLFQPQEISCSSITGRTVRRGWGEVPCWSAPSWGSASRCRRIPRRASRAVLQDVRPPPVLDAGGHVIGDDVQQQPHAPILQRAHERFEISSAPSST